MSPLPPPPPDLTVPEPPCPLPVRLHPARQQAAEWLSDWAYRRDLVRDRAAACGLGSRFALLAAYTCPEAEDLRLPAAWNAVNRLVAGRLDSQDENFARAALDRLPTGPLFARPRPASPLLAVLDELWEWTAPHRSAYWRERFVAHYRDWLAYGLLRRDLEERLTYTRRRRLDSGVEVSLDLNEAACDHELPRVLAHAQPYLELRRRATDIACWHQDLCSVAVGAALDRPSLPAVLVAGGAGWQQALDATARAVAAALRDFVAARDDLCDAAGHYPVTGHEVEYTLETLTLWLSGSLRWQRTPAVEADPLVR